MHGRNTEKLMGQLTYSTNPGFKKFASNHPLLREKDPMYSGWKLGKTYLGMTIETGKSPQSLPYANVV